MSFVDNIVQQLAQAGLEKITKPQSYDLSDKTFEKLLEKQMRAQEPEASENLLGEIGMPAGMIIEPYDPNSVSVSPDKQVNMRETSIPDISDVEIKDFKVESLFPDYMNDFTREDSPFRNIAMKYATNMYGSQGRGFVDNIADLADGLTGRL